MARAHLYLPITKANGDIIQPIVVRLLEPGTTTEIDEPIYSGPSGGTTRTNPYSSSEGIVDVYLDEPRRVRLGITPPGQNEMWLEDVDIHPDADRLVRTPEPMVVTNNPSTIGHVLKATGSNTAAWGAAPEGEGGGGGTAEEVVRATLGVNGPLATTDPDLLPIAMLNDFPADQTDASVDAYGLVSLTAGLWLVDLSISLNTGSPSQPGAFVQNQDGSQAFVADFVELGGGTYHAGRLGSFYLEVDDDIEFRYLGDHSYIAGVVVQLTKVPTTAVGGGGGEGGGATVTTLAALAALQTGGTLTPGGIYVVTDWTQTNLPGPNQLIFTATAAGELANEVLIETPLDRIGPVRGIYDWTGSKMTYIEDGLGNKLTNTSSSTALTDFPFGDTGWYGNTLVNATLTGAAASAAAGRDFYMNTVIGSEINMEGWLTGGYIRHCDLRNGSSLYLSPTFYATALKMNDASLSLDNGTPLVQLDNSYIENSSWSVENDTKFEVYDSTITWASEYIDTGAVPGFTIRASTIRNSTIDRSGSTGNRPDGITASNVLDSTVTWVATAADGVGGRILRSTVSGGSTVSITNGLDNGSDSDPVVGCVIDGESTLTVAEGRIKRSRISCGASFTTGAFTHTSVIVDGAFTETATADNTNTLKNKGFDDIV